MNPKKLTKMLSCHLLVSFFPFKKAYSLRKGFPAANLAKEARAEIFI